MLFVLGLVTDVVGLAALGWGAASSKNIAVPVFAQEHIYTRETPPLEAGATNPTCGCPPNMLCYTNHTGDVATNACSREGGNPVRSMLRKGERD